MNAAGLIRDIKGWYDEGDGGAMKSHELILDLLQSTDQPFSREQYAPGHITATALVVNESSDAVLLVFHKRLERWLLPGGHVEPDDATIIDAARREAIEETSVQLDPGYEPSIDGFDVHGIPSNGKEPYHLHHDILVRLRASSHVIAASPESREVRWATFRNIERYNLPRNILFRFLGI